MNNYTYRIKKITLKGGDIEYYGQSKETSKNKFVQILFNIVLGWENVSTTFNIERTCSAAMESIKRHKFNNLKNNENEIANIEYIDDCES